MGSLLLLGDEGPLLAGGEARAASAAQARVDRDLDDVLGLHVQRALQRGVAARRDVLVVPDGVALGGVEGDAFGEDGFGESHGGYSFSCFPSDASGASVRVKRNK